MKCIGKKFFSSDFGRKEHGVSKNQSILVDKGLRMNKKIRGGGHFCSAPFFFVKKCFEIFLNSLDNVLHPERGVNMSFLHNMEEKNKTGIFFKRG